jgi:Mg2+-importing ATPase
MALQFDPKTFWTETPDGLCSVLLCTQDGLTSDEAAARLRRVGPNSDAPARRAGLVQALG